MHRQSRRNQGSQDCKRRLEEALREEIARKAKGSRSHEETIRAESGRVPETAEIGKISRVGDNIFIGKVDDAGGRTQVAQEEIAAV